jgi:hypothetical protein
MTDDARAIVFAVAAALSTMTVAHHLGRALWAAVNFRLGGNRRLYHAGFTTIDSVSTWVRSQAWLFALFAAAFFLPLAVTREPRLAWGLRVGLIPPLVLLVLQWYWESHRIDVANLQRRIRAGALAYRLTGVAGPIAALGLIVTNWSVVSTALLDWVATGVVAALTVLGAFRAMSGSVRLLRRPWPFPVTLFSVASVAAPLSLGLHIPTVVSFFVIAGGLLLGFVSVGAPGAQNRHVVRSAACTGVFVMLAAAVLAPLRDPGALATGSVLLLSAGALSVVFASLAVRAVVGRWEIAFARRGNEVPFG